MQVKHKKEAADDLRSVFYASSKDKAMGFFEEFKNKHQKDINGMRLYLPPLNLYPTG